MNTIWKACDHLGHGLLLEVAQKVAWVRKNEAAGRISYHKRFLSAEGCYSHRAMHAQGVRIKIAQKQFAGLERQELAGPLPGCRRRKRRSGPSLGGARSQAAQAEEGREKLKRLAS